MTQDYFYDHTWTQERIRLAGLEAALDQGTHEHLTRLGAGPGRRCLEIGAGGGAVAFWLAERVAPGGVVVATDVETDFLTAAAARYPNLEVLRHDITTEDLPTGFDLVHARWLLEWLPDKREALGRMKAALRPGGVLIVEEPDFVTIFGTAQPPALRHVITRGMRYLVDAVSPDDDRVDVHIAPTTNGDLGDQRRCGSPKPASVGCHCISLPSWPRKSVGAPRLQPPGRSWNRCASRIPERSGRSPSQPARCR